VRAAEAAGEVTSHASLKAETMVTSAVFVTAADAIGTHYSFWTFHVMSFSRTTKQ
jgi:hypothetical protein